MTAGGRTVGAIALFVAFAGSIRQPAADTDAPTRPLRLILSGQSNAAALQPFLCRHDIVVGHAVSLTPIACWDDGAACWTILARAIATGALSREAEPPVHVASYSAGTVDAFVWWQGENDAGTADYGARFADLARRVRAAVGNPALLVVVMQLGPAYATDGLPPSPALSATAERRWAETDPHAVFVETHDLPFQPDRTHLTTAGDRMAAARIDRRIRDRLRRER
jgi:hypothetical protein